MKKGILVGVVIMLFMLLSPLMAIGNKTQDSIVEEIISIQENISEDEENYFKVYNTKTKKTELIEHDEYIFGVVAAEMPISYESEALKAQAVAAYTFTLFRKNENADKDYDITTDHTTDQSYISRLDVIEKWGENAKENEEKLNGIIKEVSGLFIAYNSKPILSAYFASSAGKTQNAKDVWGGDYPYLKSVNSQWEASDEGNISTCTFSKSEIKEKLSSINETSKNEEEWFYDITKNSAGYVSKLSFCGKEVSGSKIRELLNLKSNSFTITLKDNNFTFRVLGYGHGVGMSQVGANCMAKQSSTYKEILSHYYSGCEIVKK